MCFCCCTTRKAVLIYAIVITSIAFIYGIIAIANFGSSTDIYKALIERLEYLEKDTSSTQSSSSSFSSSSGSSSGSGSSYSGYPYSYKKGDRKLQYSYNYNSYATAYYVSEYANTLGNSITFQNIQQLTSEDLRTKSYGVIKSLKGIECGLGIILFLFPLIFLGTEIVFLIFIRGNKEYQVLPNDTFNILNIIHILCITFSTILIFLSLLYAFLLVVAYIQYIYLVLSIDSCAIKIVIGMVFGYYGFYYYIVLSCAFCKIRSQFLNVGCEENPGAEAKYDINGNIIPKNTQVIQQIIVPGQIQTNPQPVPIQQSQQYIPYQQPQIYGQTQQPQYIQYQQPQIYGQTQQPQIYGQTQQPQYVQFQQQPQTIEINNNGKKVDVGEDNNTKINDNYIAVTSERDNNNLVKK